MSTDADDVIDPGLLEIIVCPSCRADLVVAPGAGAAGGTTELVCQGCGLAYPVREGIPVLLVDEARQSR